MTQSATAQPNDRVMTHAIETSVDQITMAAISGEEYVSLAFATPEFGPRNLYANLGGNGLIEASFCALIWKPIN